MRCGDCRVPDQQQVIEHLGEMMKQHGAKYVGAAIAALIRDGTITEKMGRELLLGAVIHSTCGDLPWRTA